ncbi:MAG: hypothetical protein HQ546_09685 [Planctomycetes bacterium]|nr:hypothetical protein [Planctomycetota bacterium]
MKTHDQETKTDVRLKGCPTSESGLGAAWGLRRLLFAGAVLLAVVIIALWPSAARLTVAADMDRPEKTVRNVLYDRAASERAIIGELAQVNAKLDKILSTMTSGEIKVVVVVAEDTTKEAPNAQAPAKK